MAKTTKKETKHAVKSRKPKIVDPYEITTPKAPKVEKIRVVDISQPTPAELSLRIAVVETRIDRMIHAMTHSQSVKGI